MDLEFKQKESDINYEIKKSKTDIQNALLNLSTSQSNYNLSRDVFKLQKKQFEIGNFNYTTLIDTEKSLNTAEKGYIKAIYDYYLSKLNYDFSIGK